MQCVKVFSENIGISIYQNYTVPKNSIYVCLVQNFFFITSCRLHYRTHGVLCCNTPPPEGEESPQTQL